MIEVKFEMKVVSMTIFLKFHIFFAFLKNKLIFKKALAQMLPLYFLRLGILLIIHIYEFEANFLERCFST